MFVCISHRRQAAIMSFGLDGNRDCDWASWLVLVRGAQLRLIPISYFGFRISILPSHFTSLWSEDIQKPYPSRGLQDFAVPRRLQVERDSTTGSIRLSERVFDVSSRCLSTAFLIAADFVAHMNYGFSSVLKSVVESHSIGLHFGFLTRLSSALILTFPLSVSGPWEIVSSAQRRSYGDASKRVRNASASVQSTNRTLRCLNSHFCFPLRFFTFLKINTSPHSTLHSHFPEFINAHKLCQKHKPTLLPCVSRFLSALQF